MKYTLRNGKGEFIHRAYWANKFAATVIVFVVLMGCNTEGGGIKLTSDERYRIDTTVNSTMAKMSADLEKWCKDTTPILRQRLTDSLVIVREQQALSQMPIH